MKHLNLHPLLEHYRKEIEATLKPVVRITATPGKTLLWQSKFGGYPYILQDMPIEYFNYATRYRETPFPYPRNTETGEELYLLAQINFEEIPHIEPFPTKGLLQIFIDFNAGEYGRKSSLTDQTAFRIIYHPKVIKDESLLFTDFSTVSEIKFNGKEIECKLNFQESIEPISSSDFRFEKIYPKSLKDKLYYPDKIYAYEVICSYMELTNGEDGYNKNKIGGYHYSQNHQD
nr:YwqG family protein [Chitinophagaceae bacterium]